MKVIAEPIEKRTAYRIVTFFLIDFGISNNQTKIMYAGKNTAVNALAGIEKM